MKLQFFPAILFLALVFLPGCVDPFGEAGAPVGKAGGEEILLPDLVVEELDANESEVLGDGFIKVHFVATVKNIGGSEAAQQEGKKGISNVYLDPGIYLPAKGLEIIVANRLLLPIGANESRKVPIGEFTLHDSGKYVFTAIVDDMRYNMGEISHVQESDENNNKAVFDVWISGNTARAKKR